MTFIDFFAGIGGFRRGLELAGHKCVGFCEFDKFAVASYTSMHLITDKQRNRLAELPLKKRQKEILKDEYRNGEWYANDVRRIFAADIPQADCWCFGFPCQDISVAGKGLGFAGKRSSLFFALTNLIKDLPGKNRPNYLLIENVKNLLSVNRGLDFARLLIELDEIGYNAEWQVLNSKDFGVPHNRERVFIVGHLRNGCGSKIFPICGSNEKNHVEQIQDVNTTQNALPTLCDLCYQGSKITENARCLQARYGKGISNHFGEVSGVAVPVLTPDRANKRQNGRRFKNNGEPMFTLTSNDRHGVALKVFGGVYTDQSPKFARGILSDCSRCLKSDKHDAGIVLKVLNNYLVPAIWSDKYNCYIAIRKLTPRECFRLQGWSDDYFEKATFVNSNSQLYRQAGNGVTVSIIQAIGEKMF